MATAAAAIVAKRRRDILSHFLTANAVSADGAVAYQPERRVDRRQFGHLLDAGVIVEAGPGSYFVDVPAYDSWNRSRRRKVGLILGGVIAAGAALAALAS